MTLSEIFAAPPAKSRMVELDEVKNEESQEVAAGEADMLKNVKQAMASSSSAEGSSWKTMMNLLMQLRKTCNHPYVSTLFPSLLAITLVALRIADVPPRRYLLPNAESEPFTIEEHIVSASSKLVLLDKMLKDILPTGEKVLVFSGFVRMLDILEDFMNLRGYKYARLDGSTSRPRRALDIKLFQVSPSFLVILGCELILGRYSNLDLLTKSSSSRHALEDSESISPPLRPSFFSIKIGILK